MIKKSACRFVPSVYAWRLSDAVAVATAADKAVAGNAADGNVAARLRSTHRADAMQKQAKFAARLVPPRGIPPV